MTTTPTPIPADVSEGLAKEAQHHMARSRLDHSVTTLLDTTEHDFFDLMKGMLGIGGDANLIRLALIHLARHLDLPMGNGVFTARTHADEAAFRKAGIRQPRTLPRAAAVEDDDEVEV